jgi:hypothetical protein
VWCGPTRRYTLRNAAEGQLRAYVRKPAADSDALEANDEYSIKSASHLKSTVRTARAPARARVRV